MANRRGIFSAKQAAEIATQPGSEDEQFVDLNGSSCESAEDDDFTNDVPEYQSDHGTEEDSDEENRPPPHDDQNES